MASRKRRRKRVGNTSKRDTRTVERLALEEKIIARRRSGLTWDMIAAELGYKNASGPFKIFRKAVERLRDDANESVDEQRWIEVGRLEAVLRGGLYARAQRGELPAVDRLLAISSRISAYLGLDAPKNGSLTLSGSVGEDTPEATARLVREAFGEKAAKPIDEPSAAVYPPSPAGAGALPEDPPGE
jgi:hypothetical protein